MPFTIVYTSDIHGNETQYNKLHDFAKQASADAVIIGGDIAPKGISTNVFIQTQRDFLEKKLPEFARNLKKALPKCSLFLMMGNDDCAANIDVLEKQGSKLYHVIHNKRLKLTKDFDIVGYGFVPITPFGIKDWEKFDLSNPPEHFREEYEYRKRTDCQYWGWKSTQHGWVNFTFPVDSEEKDSIQKDLENVLFTANPDKTLYVMHTPPYGTNLDLVGWKGHIGSMAVRQFIEEKQPFLTLHGHIHETVAVSGRFKQKIGKTLSMSSGNCNIKDELALLVFDLYSPKNAKRLVL
ncbi:MAG: metallophosphoesterase [Nanoarchaeota archaeon]|nr:metallophosphoesterase [Nanoarchaeota archaeon]